MEMEEALTITYLTMAPIVGRHQTREGTCYTRRAKEVMMAIWCPIRIRGESIWETRRNPSERI